MKPPARSRKYTEEVRVELDLAFRTARITAPARFDWYVSHALNGRNFYAKLGEDLSGIPWWFIACIHGLECSFNFEQHLHNGDSLKRRTVNVPAGRPVKGKPPFTWRESAIDALTMPGKELDKVTDWSVPHALWLLESFNGLGYRTLRAPIWSPYLWAGTSLYTAGKYVRDGVYSATFVSQQAGAAGVIKRLLESGSEIAEAGSGVRK